MRLPACVYCAAAPLLAALAITAGWGPDRPAEGRPAVEPADPPSLADDDAPTGQEGLDGRMAAAQARAGERAAVAAALLRGGPHSGRGRRPVRGAERP